MDKRGAMLDVEDLLSDVELEDTDDESSDPIAPAPPSNEELPSRTRENLRLFLGMLRMLRTLVLQTAVSLKELLWEMISLSEMDDVSMSKGFVYMAMFAIILLVLLSRRYGWW